jgi:lipoprotein-anchoring transpeptidase ErfK/SrfK
MHHSNKYDDAPMPFAQFFEHHGIAMHAGYNPGHPASHGCVRLPAGFAKKLYSVTDLGTPVFIGA